MTAVLKLSWAESYDVITIDDICQSAEVKKGSFYYFYKSKDLLTSAALERTWEQDWKPSFDRHFSSSLNPVRRLTEHLAVIYRQQREEKVSKGKVQGCLVCTVESAVGTRNNGSALCATLRLIFDRRSLYYESAIRDAVASSEIEPCDPSEMARLLLGLIEGVASQSRIMNDPDIVRELPSMVFGLLRLKNSPRAPVVDSHVGAN